MKKIYLRFSWKNDLLEITDKENLPYDREKFLDIEADFIGKGLFCQAFKGDDKRVYLLVKQSHDDFDYSKEAVSNWGDSDNPHMPEIDSFGQITFKGIEYIVFSMPFYEPLTAKHKTAWAQFKALRQAHYSFRLMGTKEAFHNYSYDFIQSLEEGDIKNALESILNAGSNYGQEYGLEFTSKTNFSVDGQGRLILRDVLFNSELCRKIREQRLVKAGGDARDL